MASARSTHVDRMLQPVHRWIWSDAGRRVRKLMTFAEVEADGGRDILRAAEMTSDPLLRRLYLAHAVDELHHADLFRRRGAELHRKSRGDELRDKTFHADLPPAPGGSSSLLPSGDHGLDDLRVDEQSDESLLAFLHLSEKSAAGRFAIYREVVGDDPLTRAVFDEILRDEVFHMNYTHTQLARISPHGHRRRLWRARATRLWKRYLRLAAAVAGLIGSAMLMVQYFVVLPPFVWFAKRAARRETAGWQTIASDHRQPTSQY